MKNVVIGVVTIDDKLFDIVNCKMGRHIFWDITFYPSPMRKLGRLCENFILFDILEKISTKKEC